MNGIKKFLGKANGNWVEELLAVLWSYRTTPRTSSKETPFSLTYDTEAMLLVELAIGLPRMTYFETTSNDKDLRLSLDLIEETHEQSNILQVTSKRVVKALQPKSQRKRLQDRRLRPKKE